MGNQVQFQGSELHIFRSRHPSLVLGNRASYLQIQAAKFRSWATTFRYLDLENHVHIQGSHLHIFRYRQPSSDLGKPPLDIQISKATFTSSDLDNQVQILPSKFGSRTSTSSDLENHSPNLGNHLIYEQSSFHFRQIYDFQQEFEFRADL